ncbi:unnamed protein product [Rhizophagus irregularis]|nr:unnamed protein product [Rhizophagus irregularis]
MYSVRNEMIFSLNCLISGQTSDYIFNVPIGDFFLSEENTKIKFTDMTVANLKDRISRTKEVIEDKITKMNLWKVELTTYEADNLSAEDIESHERSEKMVTTSNLDKYFNNNEDKNPKKGYLHVFIVPTATDLGRKRRNTEVETTSRKRRSWAINSTIANELRDSVYFVDTTEMSGPLRDMIQKGEFVALYGARASKSTRVDQAIFKLKSKGYVCIYVSLERTNGHAGLVCLCGRAIQNNLEKKLDESRRLDFTLWSNFLATSRVTDIMIRIFRFCKN